MRTGAGPLRQLAPGLTGYGGPCHRTNDWSSPGLFADWPQCPLAWRYRVSLPTVLSAHWPGDPGPLPDMTVPGFTHGVVRASTLVDESQRAQFGTHG